MLVNSGQCPERQQCGSKSEGLDFEVGIQTVRDAFI